MCEVNSSSSAPMAEELCDAVMRHASLYSEEHANPGETIPAEMRIAGLASEYRNLILERTGVDVTFGTSAADKSRTTSAVSNLAPDSAGDVQSQEENPPFSMTILAHSRLGYVPSNQGHRCP